MERELNSAVETSTRLDVLIVTQRDDPTADFLEPTLRARGLRSARWDPGSQTLPSGMTLGDGCWTDLRFNTDMNVYRLNEVGTIWYRRPSRPRVPAGTPTSSMTDFLLIERQRFIANFWAACPRPIVNDPEAGNWASQKARQLAFASREGLRTPKTYVGNDPQLIRQLWAESAGRMIVKPFVATAVDLSDGQSRALYTARVSEIDLIADEPLLASPSIWQEEIEKRSDIRVIVLGEAVFAAEILSQERESTKVDWRAPGSTDLRYAQHLLPDEVAARCASIARRGGLYYGAIDLVYTTDLEYVFLENNPFGQWAWLEAECGLPLADAHCDLFAKLAHL